MEKIQWKLIDAICIFAMIIFEKLLKVVWLLIDLRKKMNDMDELKERFIDMISEGMERIKPKVYILIERLGSFPNVIGVYSTQEKAFKEYQKRFVEIESNMMGMNERAGIIERDLE